MGSAFTQWLAGHCYDELKLWIYDITHRFHRQYGGEFTEHLSQANFIFVQSLENYEPGRSSLTYYLSQKIWHGLLDANKTQWRRHNKHPLVSLDTSWETGSLSYAYAYPASTFLTDLSDEITRDARKVVRKILNPDKTLVGMLLRREGYMVERRALMAYFQFKYKWTERRIENAFWSIQQALKA